MAKHETFHFATREALLEKIQSLCVDIPLSGDLSPLGRHVSIGGHESPNAICVLPMEGYDCDEMGIPSPLTYRRYERYARGGAGLLWWEACAIVPEGRGTPRQMLMSADHVQPYSRLLQAAKAAAADEFGSDHRPINILQLTHSGRYSRPTGSEPIPMSVQRDPLLDAPLHITTDDAVVSDDYLAALPGQFACAAVLAQEAGFDGVDIKACHGYLLGELLGAHTRPGAYGGSFENRTRILLESIRAARAATSRDFIIASRLNVYDAHPWPYSFGTSRDDIWTPDLSEPLRLVRLLCENGANLLTSSAGNPHFLYPHVTRPYNRINPGSPVLAEEHPLESLARLIRLTGEVQNAAGSIPVMGVGYSWLRQYAPLAAAANLERKNCALVGFGRAILANPNVPREILQNGQVDINKCCVACSKCIFLMRKHKPAGCVIRDAEIYMPFYREIESQLSSKSPHDRV